MAPVLAHHPIVETLPFVVPVLALSIGLAVMTLRDRLRRKRLDDGSGDR